VSSLVIIHSYLFVCDGRLKMQNVKMTDHRNRKRWKCKTWKCRT